MVTPRGTPTRLARTGAVVIVVEPVVVAEDVTVEVSVDDAEFVCVDVAVDETVED